MLHARKRFYALAVSSFSFFLVTALGGAALATEAPSAGSDASQTTIATTHDAGNLPVTITLIDRGRESTFATEAKTFGELLSERGLQVRADDYLSDETSTPLYDGMHLEYRPAVALKVALGKRRFSLHTSAATVSDALADAHVTVGPRDLVLPDRRSAPQADGIVRITAVNVWTERKVRTIARATLHRTDGRLAVGKSRLISPGVVGLRDITLRYTRRGDSAVRVAVVSSHIVRRPRPQIVEIGSYVAPAPGPITSFARSGITSAMHLAGTVLHVIATAYIAGCYKCSGIAANGMHAGFGIIAVDPHLIPLGTKLMIPGYGRAIAGDTGGAIIGNRVDLGMDHLADAIKFGRRPMTLYVLK